jgi:putative transposase
MISYLGDVFGKVCGDFGADLVECNGEDDHVHLLTGYPPRVTVPALVNSLKGVSARRLRQRYRVRTHREHLWSPSYFAASSGGAPVSIIRAYVENQRRPTPAPPPQAAAFSKAWPLLKWLPRPLNRTPKWSVSRNPGPLTHGPMDLPASDGPARDVWHLTILCRKT